MKTFNWCGYNWLPRMNYGKLHKDMPWMWFDANQVWYSGNELALYIEKNTILVINEEVNYHPQLACGTIYSEQSFGYGTFSAEIQLPKGRNLWPAFWLVGEGKWPQGGEIDVMEAWSNKCGSYFRATIPQPPYLVPSWDTTTNVHWEEENSVKRTQFGNLIGHLHKSTGSRRLPFVCSLKNPTKHFIKYEVEWRKDIITFRVNGKTVRTYGYHIAKRLHNKKMHVVFDLWTKGLDYSLETPMMIRNFTYKPIEIL